MTGSKRFQKLMEPGYIGKMRTRNRIVKMGAQPGFFPYQDGHMQQEVIDYCEALARGGAGLITVGGTPIGAPLGKGYRIDDDKYVPGMSRLTEAIRKHDCPAFLQMFHIGPMLPANVGIPTVAASSLSVSEMPVQSLTAPREVSIPEIEEIVQIFGGDAERAKRAGFQGIEMNAGCNHFLNSFLSRAWNKRQDEYGIGSLENRARILVEIIQEIKQRNGEDFPIVALINGAEPGLKNGITSEESQGFARILQAAGADAIHVRVEFYTKPKDPGKRASTHFPDIALYPEIPYLAENIDTTRHGAGRVAAGSIGHEPLLLEDGRGRRPVDHAACGPGGACVSGAVRPALLRTAVAMTRPAAAIARTGATASRPTAATSKPMPPGMTAAPVSISCAFT